LSHISVGQNLIFIKFNILLGQLLLKFRSGFAEFIKSKENKIGRFSSKNVATKH